MTAYVVIPGSDIDQDSPVTQPLLTALRDNPLAISEGASGAPKLQDAALDTGSPTVDGTIWVLKRYAAFATAANPAMYAMLSHQGITSHTYVMGDYVAGSSLVPASAAGAFGALALTGTWMCLGRCFTDTASNTPLSNSIRVTLWFRIV